MKLLVTLFIINLCLFQIQEANCWCDEHNTWLNRSFNCDPILLKNDYSLYYQLNCDSIWLELKDSIGVKHILFSADTNSYHKNYTYPKYVRDFQNLVLLKRNCDPPSSHGQQCETYLIDKASGAEIWDFGNNLLFSDDQNRTDFIVYFTGDEIDSDLILYNVETGKKYTIDFDKDWTNSKPLRFYFRKSGLYGLPQERTIYLEFIYRDSIPKTDTLKINLLKYTP